MACEFELVEGKDEQIKILYKLILNRVHSISHSKTPNYENHKRFVRNHPYFKWYLIKLNADYIGSFYIKDDNSIGLNLMKIDKNIVISCINFIKQKYCPHPAKDSLVTKYFYINVASSNNELIKTMEVLNFPKLQMSFKI